MKKLMTLGCAVLPLWASESDGASAGVHTQTEIIPSHGLGALSAVQTIIEQKASQYILLDDALKPGADLSNLQYVVMPHVDASGALLKNRKAELNSVFAGRTDLTLLASFADDVLQVGDDFCADPDALPYSIKKIAFTGKNVKKIGNRFFHRYPYRLSITLSDLPALKSIGDGLVSRAKALMSIALRDLPALGCIGNDAQSLPSLMLSDLPALKSIGRDFASGTQARTSLMLRDLPALGCIGNDAQSLPSLMLSDLPALKSIGRDFASGTQARTSLMLRDLPALESIGHDFASEAQACTSLMLRDLPALEKIGRGFALGTRTLDKLDIRGINTEVRIDPDFLKDAPATALILVDHPIVAEKICAVYKGEAQIIVE